VRFRHISFSRKPTITPVYRDRDRDRDIDRDIDRGKDMCCLYREATAHLLEQEADNDPGGRLAEELVSVHPPARLERVVARGSHHLHIQ
jgi:hypothetical protein